MTTWSNIKQNNTYTKKFKHCMELNLLISSFKYTSTVDVISIFIGPTVLVWSSSMNILTQHAIMKIGNYISFAIIMVQTLNNFVAVLMTILHINSHNYLGFFCGNHFVHKVQWVYKVAHLSYYGNALQAASNKPKSKYTQSQNGCNILSISIIRTSNFYTPLNPLLPGLFCNFMLLSTVSLVEHGQLEE